jgi:Leucine-rich repeat (LRR) protein
MIKNYFLIPFLIFSCHFLNAQTNLVPNGNLENWTNSNVAENWTIENTIEQNDTDAIQGFSCASLSITDNTLKPKITSLVPLENGKEYNISYRYKYIDNNYNGSHPITLKIIKAGSATTITKNSFATNNDWTEVNTTFTPDQTGDYELSISIGTFDTEAFNVLIDYVRAFDALVELNNIVNIPDSNFKNALLSYDPKIDLNDDGEIQFTEAENVMPYMYLSSKNIDDLTGIEAFTNIKILDCGANNLTDINISQNTFLESIYCRDNKFQELDFSSNTNLKGINCGGYSSPQLSKVDISKNINLEVFESNGGDLTEINLTNNTKLRTLDLSHNEFNSIDVSKNTLLKGFSCVGNNLTVLDISNNTKLESLNCFFNKIKELDLSNHPDLKNLDCRENYLISLNIANGNNTILTSLDATTNPLSCIQVDNVTDAENKSNWRKETITKYNVDCSSFVPEIANIPDVNFKNYLLNDTSININNDDEIQLAEAHFQKYLYPYNQNINDLTGIEFFVNIIDLDCSSNNLTSLDISSNKLLTSLSCSNNNLNSLDISQITQLETLYCYENELSSLDLTNNLLLSRLYFGNNQISSIDLSKNTKLQDLACALNNLTALDLSSNINLTALQCNSNNLSSLNIQNCDKLTRVICGSNPSLSAVSTMNKPSLEYFSCVNSNLTEVDFSQSPLLYELRVSANKIAELNLINNSELKTLYSGGNLLTELDLSNNTKLETVYLENSSLIETVDIKNGNNSILSNFYSKGSLQLRCIQVDNKTEAENNTNWQKDVTTNYSENCSATADVNDLEFSNQLLVYPNPVKDIISITSNSATIVKNITIFNLLGKEMFYTKNLNFNISNLPTGLYVLKIQGEQNKVAIKKFIKE